MNRLRAFALSTFFALHALSAASLAFAQDGSPDDRATSFHAVSGGEHEDVPGGDLLVAAYAVALVALVGYVGYVGAIQQGTQRELARLEALVRARSTFDEDKD